MCLKFSQIKPWTVELAALERLKNPHRLIMGKCWDHSSAFILNRSYSFLQINRTTIKAWMNLNFVKILSPIMELTALEQID